MVGLDPPDFDRPFGTGLCASLPRHSVPGYDHLSLRDKSLAMISLSLRNKSHLSIEGASH